MPGGAGAMASIARWLAAGALDGTLCAAAAWLASVTLLRRSTGRVLSLLWLSVLVGFVLVRPFEVHAVPHLRPFRTALAVESQVGSSYGWLGSVYAGVVVLCLARLLAKHRQLRRRIRAFPIAAPALVDCVRRAASALSLSVVPEVRIADALATPFTFGPWQPTLVLPRRLCVPGARLDAVLLHELSHIQRFDHWLIWFERLVTTVFFFWPPVHWASRRLDEVRELACDERAIECGGFSAVEYGQHLVAVVALSRERLATGGALRFGRSGHRLERRIDHLLRATRSRRWSGLEAGVLAVLALGSLLSVRPARELVAPRAEISAAASTAATSTAAPATTATSTAAPATAAPAPSNSGATHSSAGDRDMSADVLDGPNMSFDESAGEGCVRQSCGTQCVP
jgi:hypothetical protein